MILRAVAFLLIAPACLAQMNESTTTPSSSDNIAAITTQANQGNTDAQLKLADAYLRGRGIAQSDTEGFRWFLVAAEKGNPEAQYAVGSLYGIGRGVNRDDAEATKWFLKAAENGNAKAQYNMGVRYAYGRGVSKDDQQAASWFRKSAEQGLTVGEAGLAAGYANGLGLPKDKTEALKWYTKAAEQGLAEAQLQVGLIFYKGNGISVNYQQRCSGSKNLRLKKIQMRNLISESCMNTDKGCKSTSLKQLTIMNSQQGMVRRMPSAIWLRCISMEQECRTTCRRP